MATFAYSVYTTKATEGVPVDLSLLFFLPGVAKPSYQNLYWQLAFQDEGTGYAIWSGDVNDDGSLDQGSAPDDFIFDGLVDCNAILDLQIIFEPDPDCPCCNNLESCPAGGNSPNSVELATGKFVFQKELLSVAGLGSGSWNFDLNYKANFDIEGILGKNFAYPQFMHLEELTGGYLFQNDVQLVTNTLSRVIFINNGSGVFTPRAGSNSRATLKVVNQFESTEEYILTSVDGTVTTFYGFHNVPYLQNPNDIPAPGQIKSIVDRYGNSQTYSWGNSHSYVNYDNNTAYDGFPQLLSVTDSYGRTTSYSYYGAEGNYRLQELTDFLGRKLNFQYDSDDHLVAVVTPSILKAAPGNTFPGGTAYVFQYDVGNANPARRDDLIKIWYPNQTQEFLDAETRTVNVSQVYANATPRYQVTYGQNLSDIDTYGKVLTETLGDPVNEVGGVATFDYTTCSDDLPVNIIDPLLPPPTSTPSPGTTAPGGSPLVSRTIYVDRNGNRIIYDFNATVTYTYDGTKWVSSSSDNRSVSRQEVQLNRSKNSLELSIEYPNPPFVPPSPYPNYAVVPPYVTWTKFNAQNQPIYIVYPEGNSVAYAYDAGNVTGLTNPYVPRVGLLLSETRYPGNTLLPALPNLPIHSRDGSNGQTTLTKRYFYEPLFNQLCAVIDERGSAINGSTTYFTPQNGGTTPTNSDQSRYATINTFDYQKDTSAAITGDSTLQALLGLNATQIGYLITYVNGQMTATDGTGGIPTGFPVNLGDINGDGTGNGASSGLPEATHLGNIVKITHPSVRLVGGATQQRIELFTVNDRGQVTTATDPEGNLTVTTRYPENDPEGSGQNVSSTLSTQQYGLVREIHRDADPADVMSLVGASGDLVAFVPGIITRNNTPGVYQDLVTRYEGSANSGSGCVSCGYDAMGNVLNETDPRGFTTVYDRNEMGEVYRVTSPAPYNFRVETSYDANRNVIQVDTEDLQVQYNSPDPTSAGYGTFTPTGSGSTAQVPMIAGLGGQLRPGWFSNLMTYDILDDKIEDDIDATGSTPANLITQYEYDANQNLIKITKPAGNTVEYDYDERNLKIAERVGYDPANSNPGAVTIYSYDGNRNLLNVIGPVDHNASGTTAGATSLTAYIVNAFGSGSMLTATGDWVLQNTYDGFNRVVTATDAVGGVTNNTYDPTSTLIQKQTQGTIGGATPVDHTGSGNVTLANAVSYYDEAQRLYQQQQDVFMPLGGSGYTITHTGGGLDINSTDNGHTAVATLTSGDSSYVLSQTVYDRAGRVAATLSDLQPVADTPTQTTYAYDGANRQILSTDPLGNTVATVYDANGSPAQVTRTEVCQVDDTMPAVANEIFVSFTWFDCLNRPVVSGTQGADGCLTSNLNLCCPWQGLPSTLFSLLGYDSRGNRSTVTDPKGNVVVSLYDGASRLIETQQELRQNGDGRSAPEPNKTFLSPGGIIRTEYVYDGNSRLVALVDDRGATTVYVYDTLDRLITKTLADGTFTTRVYDLSGCLTSLTDENGTVLAFVYDALSRKTSLASTPASGSAVVSVGTIYDQYDGLSRVTQNLANGGANAVQLAYDSISRVLEEYQVNGAASGIVVHNQWLSLVATQVTYPNNITTTNGYDVLYRKTSLAGAYGATPLDNVAWRFFGPSRVVETNWGSGENSLIATQMNNLRTHSAVQTTVPLPGWGNISTNQLGYDGAGRMITKRYMIGGINSVTKGYANTTALAGYTTAYDRSGNKLYERHLEAESRSHLYQPFNSDGSFDVGYDSANRLRQYQRGVLDSTIIPYRSGPGASIATPTTLPGANQVKTYGLDGLGNWKNSRYTTVTDSDGTTDTTVETRNHNYVNEITATTDVVDGGSPATTGFTYDKNGNLLNDGVRSYTWDALNRLVQINKVSGGAVIAAYAYDGLNRRIQKTVSNGGLTGDITNGTSTYLYDRQQMAMSRDSSGNWGQAYFWGQYIDELLFFSSPAETVPNTYRVISDLLYRSTAIVDTNNVITETYDTDAYGNTICYSSPGLDGIWFSDTAITTHNPINCTIFTGRQFDPESLIYYYRARYYSPNIGRFISRDPLKNAELSQGLNLYWYVKNNPANNLDFSGLCCEVQLAKWNALQASLQNLNQILQTISDKVSEDSKTIFDDEGELDLAFIEVQLKCFAFIYAEEVEPELAADCVTALKDEAEAREQLDQDKAIQSVDMKILKDWTNKQSDLVKKIGQARHNYNACEARNITRKPGCPCL